LDENSIISPKEVSSGSKNVKVKVYGGKKFSTKADVNNMVKVPNLYGMKKSKAISTLKEYGLNYEIETKTNDTFLGNVFYQDTKAGKKVKVGSTVTITVGKDFKKATTSDTEDDEYDVEWFLGNE
jgi:beta-lactam-binding protein with PASTA domain